MMTILKWNDAGQTVSMRQTIVIHPMAKKLVKKSVTRTEKLV